MKYLALLLFFIPSAYADNSADSTDESLLQAKEYCLSMVQDGTPEDEATEFVSQCVAEQSIYIDEAREDGTLIVTIPERLLFSHTKALQSDIGIEIASAVRSGYRLFKRKRR